MPELLLRLAESQHDAGLGDDVGLSFLGRAEDVETLSELCFAVADKGCEGFDGFDVMRVDVKAAGGYHLDHFEIALVVAAE